MTEHSSLCNSHTVAHQMSIEELAFNSTSDHVPEYLDGLSLSAYFTPIFDDPCNSAAFNDDPWWLLYPNLDQELINTSPTSFNGESAIAADPIVFDNQIQDSSSDSSKKRKASDDSSPETSEIYQKNPTPRISEADDGKANKKKRVPARNKRVEAKPTGANSSNGNTKEGRWAEHLLNPCAAAFTAGNFSRVQHFIFVLKDLASPIGSADHRLADHGLKALKYHLFPQNLPDILSETTTFASVKPKFFKDALLYFNDINPWFRIPSSIANSSILQILVEQGRPCNLHILDIGVSHGVQWPTLFAELNKQPGGPPSLVRLTVVNPSKDDNDQSRDAPFASGSPGHSFTSKLLRAAETEKINLKIDTLDNYPLQNLNSEVIHFSPDETLIVCAQFRLHNLDHNFPDDRTQFLRFLKSLDPKGVILSENNADCICNNCCDFATAFSRRVDYLWRFLDSTSIAYKGRDSDERRMMEGEAAKALTSKGEMNERKEKWCERMKSVGFVGEAVGEDAIAGARVLLKKYDSNWEMRVDEKDSSVGLSWKGQPVSFCSIWR